MNKGAFSRLENSSSVLGNSFWRNHPPVLHQRDGACLAVSGAVFYVSALGCSEFWLLAAAAAVAVVASMVVIP